MANEFITRKGIKSLGGITFPHKKISSNYTINNDDYLIECIGSTPFTATLPTAVGINGKHYLIKNNTTVGITITTTSSETIDGSSSIVINSNTSIYVISNGSNWIDAATGGNADTLDGKHLSEILDGTTNYISKFTSANTIGNSQIFDNGTNVGIGTTTPVQQLDITGSFNLPHTTPTQNGVIYKSNIPFIHNFNYGNNGTVTTEGQNTFIGINAGNFTMGSSVSVPGYSSYNTGIGVSTLQNNTTGYYNSAIGVYALQNNTTGYYNSAIGVNALRSNTTGNNNSAIGVDAGRYLSNGSTGRETGNNGLYLGCNSKASANGTDNEIVIGFNAVGKGSNTAAYGNSSMVKHIFEAGSVGIGTSTPSEKLEVVGNIETDHIKLNNSVTFLDINIEKAGMRYNGINKTIEFFFI